MDRRRVERLILAAEAAGQIRPADRVVLLLSGFGLKATAVLGELAG